MSLKINFNRGRATAPQHGGNIMTIDTFLKKLPDVLAVLTSEKTQERMSGIYNDVEDLTEIVMESTQDAAEDLTAILTDILLSFEVIEVPRSMRNPADVTRLKRIETMFQPKTVRERLDEATAVLTSKEVERVIKKACEVMKERESV